MTDAHPRRLLVLRHAKSAWDTDAPTDFERPLALRGRRDAPRMGRWLSERDLVPEAILSSAARRARQTARRVAEAMGLDADAVLLDDRIYDATVGTILDLLGDHDGGAGSLMVVGHNPTMEELVRWLARDPPPWPRGGKLMPTCAVAHLAMPAAWTALERGCARLVDIHRPKEVLRQGSD